MRHTTESFLAAIKPYVIEDMRKNGILASLTAAQALLESDRGNSGLTVRANNLFGIKGKYKGDFITLPTKEWSKAKGYYTIHAAFRKYPSWAESIADHSDLFNRLSRYANLRGLKDYKLACLYVRQDGYATAPHYTAALVAVIERYKLHEWDREAADPEPCVDTSTFDTIRKGDAGTLVTLLQNALGKRDFPCQIDGSFGAETEYQVKEFQKSRGLVVDGIVGKQTWRKLFS